MSRPSRPRGAKELAKAEHAEAVARLHVAKVLAFPRALASVEGLAATYQAEIVQLRFRIGTLLLDLTTKKGGAGCCEQIWCRHGYRCQVCS